MSKSTSGGGKPVAIVPLSSMIAAKVRLTTPQGAQAHKPPNINTALRKAINSSPQAKAAFAKNPGAIRSINTHAKALLAPGNKSTASKVGHGVGALGALRKVTGDMVKQQAKNPAPMEVKSNVTLSEKGQKRVEKIQQAMQGPRPNLLSAMGQGFQLMREMRATGKAMRKEAQNGTTTQHADPGKKTGALSAMGAHAQKPPGVLSQMSQGVGLLRQMRGVTHAMGEGAQLRSGGAQGAERGGEMKSGPQTPGFQVIGIERLHETLQAHGVDPNRFRDALQLHAGQHPQLGELLKRYQQATPARDDAHGPAQGGGHETGASS